MILNSEPPTGMPSSERLYVTDLWIHDLQNSHGKCSFDHIWSRCDPDLRI